MNYRRERNGITQSNSKNLNEQLTHHPDRDSRSVGGVHRESVAEE